MAVAGVNNVSVLESSYHGENYSPLSRRWANQERPITRTSFIRNMWRDLEGESRFRENGRQQPSDMANRNTRSLCSCSSVGGAESDDASIDTNEVENECPRDQNQIRIQNGQEDNGNLCVHRPPAFGVADKQRVRQVFHEWGSKSFNECALNDSHMSNCSRGLRAQRLCENECKRVRIVREWIESSTQQADTGHSSIEEQQATEFGCQIDRVRNRFDVNHGVGARSIRRLYGRQVLLDLLTNFEKERKRELQNLLEHRLVSNFAHRNRIQSLLRGRFLWNQRFVQDDKSTTNIAASELGLLRKTHAVSDLRKGFLSMSNDCELTPDGPESDASSDNGMKYHEEGNEFETANTGGVGASHKVDSDSQTNKCGDPQEYSASAEERHERAFKSEGGEQLSPDVDFAETTSQDQDGSVDRNQGVHHLELSQQVLGLESTSHGPPQNEGELEVHEASDHLDPLETNAETLPCHEDSAQVEEWQEPITEDDEGGWHHLTHIESDAGLDANSSDNEREWYQENPGSDFQESHDEWYDNGLEETSESWFSGAVPVGRTDVFYNFDDDNSNRLELRELTSRRRVSNLLQSEFRVRLDQLIQSYVERQDQDQASESDDEWMLERERQDQDETDSVTEAVEATEGVPAIPHTHQDDTLIDVADWQHHDIHQHLETEWEIINGLRIDMVRLQERMNTMQKTLETCMNMQLELQRSVQQEVSSALNRSSNLDDGVCFLCCDTSFDSSPDRCGHIYICSKCAEKINWSKLKESLGHP